MWPNRSGSSAGRDRASPSRPFRPDPDPFQSVSARSFEPPQDVSDHVEPEPAEGNAVDPHRRRQGAAADAADRV